MIAIHMRRYTYDANAPFIPWVFAIARRKLIDHLRRSQRAMVELPIDAVEEVLMAADDDAGVESALDLHKLLARLPEKSRRTIRHVKLEDLSVAEGAQYCGISVSDVKIQRTSRPEGARGKGSRARERTRPEELIDMLALVATAGKIILCGQRNEFIG
jgi:RNA polymerase sigma factor (sigma-70 family)